MRRWCVAIQDGKAPAAAAEAGKDTTDTMVPNSGKIWLKLTYLF